MALMITTHKTFVAEDRVIPLFTIITPKHLRIILTHPLGTDRTLTWVLYSIIPFRKTKDISFNLISPLRNGIKKGTNKRRCSLASGTDL